MFDCDFVQQIIRTCGKEPQCIECIVRTMSVSLTALVNFYVCCRPTVRYTGAQSSFAHYLHTTHILRTRRIEKERIKRFDTQRTRHRIDKVKTES